MKIRTSTRSGPRNITGEPAARAFLAGITERGTLVPKSCRSIIEFENEFGGLQSFSASMYRSARTYFAEGGGELVVCRAIGPAATLSTGVVKDRTAVTGLDTMRIDAASVGGWGTGITYTIEVGNVPDSVHFSVFLGAERVTYVHDATTVAALAASTVNDPYVRVTDLGAVSVYPTRLPKVTGAPTSLTGGADDRASVTAVTVAAALDRAGLAYGSGAVAAPGYDATTIGALLIAHCVTNRRVAILAGGWASTGSDLTTMAAGIVGSGEYAGLFAPWVTIPEGSTTAAVSPEGYVLGARSRAMSTEGFWQPGAGQRSAAQFVVGPVVAYDAATIDLLAAARVSGITSIGGYTVVYGWRSLSPNSEQYTMLSARDVMNTLTARIEAELQPYVFETIDGTGQLLARVKGALVGLLQPVEDAGGFAPKVDADGKEINPGYRVDVSVLSETALSATVIFRLSGVAESIEVSIVKAAFTATI